MRVDDLWGLLHPKCLHLDTLTLTLHMIPQDLFQDSASHPKTGAGGPLPAPPHPPRSKYNLSQRVTNSCPHASSTDKYSLLLIGGARPRGERSPPAPLPHNQWGRDAQSPVTPFLGGSHAVQPRLAAPRPPAVPAQRPLVTAAHALQECVLQGHPSGFCTAGTGMSSTGP